MTLKFDWVTNQQFFVVYVPWGTARVTVFKEINGVPLNGSLWTRNSINIIVNIGGKFWTARARFAS
jgi:hypothetical protein